MNYDLFGNAISSPESAFGASRRDGQESTTTRPYGADHALANLSARQAKAAGLMTSGTYGPRSTISSSNAALRSSLASKLRELTETLGSTLYRLTWTQRLMPSGLRKPSQRASERRTSGPEIIGSRSTWATPASRDWKDGEAPSVVASGRADKLAHAVQLSSWPTPSTMDNGNTGTAWESRRVRTKANLMNGNGFGLILPMAVQLTGWPTTQASDQKARCSTAEASDRRIASGEQVSLEVAAFQMTDGPARLTASGVMLIGSDAETKNGGQLSPAHSLWLMLGPFATAWASSGERVTRSRSAKRKASSKPSSQV